MKGEAMKRRGFLQAVGGVGAAIAAGGVGVAAMKAPALNPDDFMAHGYRVKWREFMPQPAQNVIVGMWHAKHESQDLQWVSTTLGQCYPSRDWEVIDLCRKGGWPLLTGFSTDAERAAVKERARTKLLRKLV